ncbi:MAG: hypothetical protein HY401_02875 [Elusimicrobia bacterium]|nr:hypothetical protein [Elusimicrobiota bacterium]
MIKKRVAFVVVIVFLSTAAGAGQKFTKEELGARFYYDLGPSAINVSAYPADQKANYAIFAKTCSQCHSLARPINSPLIERKDWDRYVKRMHIKTKSRLKTEIAKPDAQAIVDFLTYDAQIRKVERKADFEAKTNEFKKLFEQVKQEKARRQAEENKRKAKPSQPYTGDKP